MRRVSIDLEEFRKCTELALLRMIESDKASLNHASTYERKYTLRLQEETTGALAEYAVAKEFGWDFSWSVNTFHDIPDVGRNIEVRGTRRTDGRLIVRDNDDDDRWYVLVIDAAPEMYIMGRIKGAAAKQDQFLDNPNGVRKAWFVPMNALEAL